MDDRRRVAETGRDPVAGKIIETMEIAARHGAVVEVKRGQVVRVIDVEGAQVGDLGECYSPQNTVLFNRTVYPKVGALLVSNRGRPMMRLVADTVGVHDLICGSCSDEYYRNRLDHHEPHRSCRGNLAEAVAPWGSRRGTSRSRSTCSCDGPFSPTAPWSPWPRPPGPATTRTSSPRWTWSWPTRPAPPTSPRRTPTTRRPCGSSSTSRATRADRFPAHRNGCSPRSRSVATTISDRRLTISSVSCGW